MYKIPIYSETMFIMEVNTVGETIEQKVKRLIQNKEPIKDGAPPIFTERSKGVNPAYNIRTDRFEIAVDAMTRLLKSKEAKREDLAKVPEQKDKEAKVIQLEIGEPKPTHGKASEK